MPTHPAGLVPPNSGIDDVFEQGAIRALGLAVALDHVGVEGAALRIGFSSAGEGGRGGGVHSVVEIGEFGVVGAEGA